MEEIKGTASATAPAPPTTEAPATKRRRLLVSMLSLEMALGVTKVSVDIETTPNKKFLCKNSACFYAHAPSIQTSIFAKSKLSPFKGSKKRTNFNTVEPKGFDNLSFKTMHF
jgi:hypothetical protein